MSGTEVDRPYSVGDRLEAHRFVGQEPTDVNEPGFPANAADLTDQAELEVRRVFER